jgi:predicted amidohydrolase YtcJ
MRMILLVLGAALLTVVGMSDAPRAEEKGSVRSTVPQTSGSDGAFLFTNGTIYIEADKKAYNLLVKDGKVAGWNVQPEKYPSAAILDLKGGAAYPGFIDSHVHLMESGTFFRLGANLVNCADADAVAKKLAEKVKSISESGVVLGVGFSLRDYDKWSLEDLAKIDKITGNRPAFLADKLGHNAVINTATMKLAGLTPTTPVPVGGKMVVESGRLTGMVRESAMSLPWSKIFAGLKTEDVKAGTLMMLKHWASIGYSGVVDLMGAPGLRFMRPDLFVEMEKEGTLPLRINYCYTIFDLNDVDDAAKYRGNDTDLVRFVGCKIFVDGAYAGGEAWTSWKNKQGNYGLQQIYTDDARGQKLNLNRIVAKVEEYGMNMHYHVQGDVAIGAVLDALEKVRAEKGRITGIHTLIHLAFPTDEQIERIKRFDGQVVATAQPGFWPVESDSLHYYGERAKYVYPIKNLVDSGVSVGMSTDFSVSPIEYSPAAVVMGVAATGGGDPAAHPPLSVRDVVHGLTVGSTRTTGKNDTGKLDTGYKADMVVYEKDLYSVLPPELSKDYPKLLSTWVGGRKTYEAAR